MPSLSSTVAEAYPGNVQAQHQPPWLAPEAFAQPPAPLTYGYCSGNHTYDCSCETLIHRIEHDSEKSISLVWTPESTRLTVPEEQPWLADALRTREAANLGKQLRFAMLNSLVWGGIVLLTGGFKRGVASFHLLALVFMGVVPLIGSIWGFHRLKAYTVETMESRVPDARYLAWIQCFPTPWTWTLLGFIGAVAVGQFLSLFSSNSFGHGILAAGIVKDAVRSGEWWRLLTGTLLHGNVIHFVFNAAAMIGLSRIIETTFNRTFVPLVFVISALVGSFGSLLFLPHATSVGASGGIMGLLGFIVIAAWKHGNGFPFAMRRSLLTNVLMIAVIGTVAHEFIDNAAHAGGLVAGGAVAYQLSRVQPIAFASPVPRSLFIWSLVAWLVIGATTILCLYKLFAPA